jgi:hypothetical protein
MGNHLVAKLAFFPPHPAKYTKEGKPSPASVALRACVRFIKKHVQGELLME